MWLYLQRERPVLESARRLLHYAPETFLGDNLRKAMRGEIVAIDMVADADVRADAQRLPFASGAFDLALCSHVLEHVERDADAIRELRRVLAPGARAMVMVPLDLSRPTIEDASVTTWAERERRFGQGDHVRWYGRDLADRLRAGGLDATLLRPSDLFDAKTRRRAALSEADVLVVARPT